MQGVLTQDLADGGVVHVRKGLQDSPALVLGPNHEGVHGSLDVTRGRSGAGFRVTAGDLHGTYGAERSSSSGKR